VKAKQDMELLLTLDAVHLGAEEGLEDLEVDLLVEEDTDSMELPWVALLSVVPLVLSFILAM
jgi:hypothetical protein